MTFLISVRITLSHLFYSFFVELELFKCQIVLHNLPFGLGVVVSQRPFTLKKDTRPHVVTLFVGSVTFLSSSVFTVSLVLGLLLLPDGDGDEGNEVEKRSQVQCDVECEQVRYCSKKRLLQTRGW